MATKGQFLGRDVSGEIRFTDVIEQSVAIEVITAAQDLGFSEPGRRIPDNPVRAEVCTLVKNKVQASRPGIRTINKILR